MQGAGSHACSFPKLTYSEQATILCFMRSQHHVIVWRNVRVKSIVHELLSGRSSTRQTRKVAASVSTSAIRRARPIIRPEARLPEKRLSAHVGQGPVYPGEMACRVCRIHCPLAVLNPGQPLPRLGRPSAS